MKIKKILGLFIITVVIYNLSWVVMYVTGVNKTLIPSEDTIPAIYLPLSIVKEKNFDLNEYYDFLLRKYPNPENKTGVPFYLKHINGRYLAAFPVIAPILSVPIYTVPVLLLNRPIDFVWPPILAKISASIIAAISFVFVLLALKKLMEEKKALILALIYGFGTCTFALSSQGLWQHAPTEMFFAITIYILLSALEKPTVAGWSGLSLALAVISRPTSIVVAVILTLYVLQKHRNQILKFILAAIPGVAFMFWYNLVYFGSIFSSAYDKKHMFYNWKGPFPEGFLGLWLSPSKGLLTYSPIFLFSLLGIYLTFRNKKEAPYTTLFKYFSVLSVAFTLMMGKWYHWYGGWSFGYRMAVDITPFLILLIVPVLKSKLFFKLKVLFYFFALWSVLIQFAGVVFFDGEWHARFDRGFKDSAWLWSVKNSEMVFYVRKILSKLGFL